MKSILVLVPERRGGPPPRRCRVDLRHAVLAEAAAGAAPCSSVIVVNDGGADTIRRLLAAIDMRQRREDLCIGLLTYIEEVTGADAVTWRGFGPPDLRLPALGELGPRLRVELDGRRLNLEYQAV